MRRNYDKFFTPQHVATFMAGLLDPKPGDFILEPSAGRGSLVRAVSKWFPLALVMAVESDPRWETALTRCAYKVFIEDFLTAHPMSGFDGCIANPPFGNGVDLDAHVARMQQLVRDGGTIVTILPCDYWNLPPNTSAYKLKNWAGNNDGSQTRIKIVKYTKE